MRKLLVKSALIGLATLVLSGAGNTSELSRREGRQIVNQAMYDVFGHSDANKEGWFYGAPIIFDAYTDYLDAPSEMTCEEVGADYNAGPGDEYCESSVRKTNLQIIDKEFVFFNFSAFDDSTNLYNAAADSFRTLLE